MRIRSALRDDLLGLGRVAEAAIWDSYTGLLKPDTIGRLITASFSASALRRSLLRGGLIIAHEGGRLLGFGDAVVGDEALDIDTLLVDPVQRRRGVARRLVVELRRRHPLLPLRMDVMLGALDAERFFESMGFVPGEVVHRAVFEDDIVERRWWQEPIGRRVAVGR